MADDDKTITGQYLTREQAKREQTTEPVPLSLSITYDPNKAPPPPGTPEGAAAAAAAVEGPGAAPEGAQPAAAPAAPEAVAPEAVAPEAAAPAAPEQPPGAQPQQVANEAKSAFEEIIKQFLKDVGVTQPLGEKGIIESTIGTPGKTTGDVGDLIRRVGRGLDLALQVASAPVVGAGTLAGKLVEQAAPLPYQAAAAAGVPVPEALTKPATGASRAVKEFTTALGSMMVGPGAVVGPLAKTGPAKRAAESGRSLALKGEARAAIAELRGPKAGQVRLYRGEARAVQGRPLPDWIEEGLRESGARDAQGRWYTDDPKIAAWYAKEAGEQGRVAYVDVPRDVYESSRVAKNREAARFSADPEREVFLPREWAEKSTEVSGRGLGEVLGQRGAFGFEVPQPPKAERRKPTLRPATKAEAEIILGPEVERLQAEREVALREVREMERRLTITKAEALKEGAPELEGQSRWTGPYEAALKKLMDVNGRLAEAERIAARSSSTLQVGDKLMAIQWGEMSNDQAIADTVKKLRALYTEKHAIPIAETQQLANQLREFGFEDRVLKRALVDGNTRAEAQALMDISRKGIEHSDELREQLRGLAPGTPEYQRVFQEFQVQIGISGRYIQLLDDLVGEAGGTLRIAQEAAQQIGGKRMDWMRDYADKVSKGLIRDVEGLPEMWDALPREQQRWQFTKLASKHGWDILRELVYDSMLFTIKGNIANIVSNAVNMKRPLDMTLAHFIGQGRHGIETMMGMTSEPAIPLRQAAASGQGMLAAMTEAHWAAWDTFLTARSRFGDEFKTVQRAISGERFRETLAAKNINLSDPVSIAIDVTGFTFGVGNRFLGGADEWFKMVAYSGRSYELAAEHAAKVAKTPAEIKAAMREFLINMPDEAKREAVAHAHYQTFTEPLQGKLKQMHEVVDSPLLVTYIPFFKTLVNVMKVGFEHFPGLNFLVEKSRKDILAGGTRRDMALAKLSEGTALLIIGNWYYDADKLTGGQPDNKVISQIYKDMGWQPDAWAFHDDDGNPTGYMSINRLDPGNQAFIMAGRMRSNMEDWGIETLSDATKEEMALASALAIGEYSTEISFMKGAKDAIETYTTDSIREAGALEKSLVRKAAQLSMPTAFAQITAANDPYMREAEGYTQLVCARSPWCSQSLYPQRKLNGEPRLRLQAVGPKWLEAAIPLPYSQANPDPVSLSIVENRMGVSFPSRVIMGRKPSELEPPQPAKEGIKLSDDQFDLYQRLAGNELKIPMSDMNGVIRGLGYEGPLPKNASYGMWDLLTALVQTDFYQNTLTPTTKQLAAATPKERLALGSPSGKEKLVLGIMSHYRTAAVGEMVLREKQWLGDKYDPEKDFQTQYVGKKLTHAEAMGGPAVRRQAEEALKQMPPGMLGPGPIRYPARQGNLPATLGR